MSKLLYVEASPRKERSASIAVARHFLAEYGKRHPQDTIETLDLWDLKLPRFDKDVLEAKYAILHGSSHTPGQKRAWGEVERVIRHFLAADKYVFSVPMWNFGIPYVLKHYIDVLVQPGLTFSWSPEAGYTGLVTGRPAALIYARGGSYPKGTPGEMYDQQSRYMAQILGFIGITNIREIYAEPTLGGPEAKADAIRRAEAQVNSIIDSF
jgi:FMN-dependent NADH-azoreductase